MSKEEGPPFKHYAALICKNRKDYIKHMDALVFMAERNKMQRIITTFAADPDGNFIINGVKYLHAESVWDLKNKHPIAAFMLVGDWEKNPNNIPVYNFAKRYTRVYGRVIKTPLQMVKPRSLILL